MFWKGLFLGTFVQLIVIFGFPLVLAEGYGPWAWGTRGALFFLAVVALFLEQKRIPRDLIKGALLSFFLFLLFPLLILWLSTFLNEGVM